VKDLLPIAERIGAILKQRKETIAVAESSSGGLIAASMLSVGGASAYFLGGAVVYTRAGFLEYVTEQAMPKQGDGLQEGTALALARAIRDKRKSTWGIAEIGAAGPAGNRYGDPAGTSCIAVVGSAERSATIRTGSDNRVANMRAFASGALELLLNLIEAK